MRHADHVLDGHQDYDLEDAQHVPAGAQVRVSVHDRVQVERQHVDGRGHRPEVQHQEPEDEPNLRHVPSGHHVRYDGEVQLVRFNMAIRIN